jgi:DNA uptake protein ComE-like DNA-binding protein
MKKLIKDFFTFEKRGQKGLVFLVLVLIIQLIVLWVLNYYQPIKKIELNLVQVNPQLLDSISKKATDNNQYNSNNAFHDDVIASHSYKKPVKRFKFNPNTISDNQWQDLGLNVKQINSIRKYLNKGGRFKKETDVLKFKFVNENIWNELIPYIVLDHAPILTYNKPLKDSLQPNQTEKAKEYAERKNAFTQALNFEFNTCTRWNLKQLDLIDSITIDKLMRYKKGLGGFVSLAQLYETQGIDTTNFYKLKSHLTLDLMSVKTININNCDVSQLSKHPYLSYNVAMALVNYRNAHGKFTQIADLKKCMAMNDNLLKKIAPYLRLSDE